jgi:phage terminase small subunit
MPNRRTPNHLLRMVKSTKVRPNDAPRNDAELGDAPSYLTADEKAAWSELEPLLLPGTCTAAERPVLAILARLWAEFRSGAPMDTSRIAQLRIALEAFGLSPTSREKIMAGDTRDDAHEALENALATKRASP